MIEQFLSFKNRDAWRSWLDKHHDKSEGVQLRFHKKSTGRDGLSQRHAVEEALCFGWIDSQLHSLHDGTYVQRFTPRRAGSLWSALNKRRVTTLIKDGRMTAVGLAVIDAAKKDGSWDSLTAVEEAAALPHELAAALKNNARAREAFETLPAGARKTMLYFVTNPKKRETREKRVGIALYMLEENIRFDIHTRVSDLEAAMQKKRS